MLRPTTAALGASCLFFFLTTSAHASEAANASPASPASPDPAASPESAGGPAAEQPASSPLDTAHDDLLLAASAGAFGGASNRGGGVLGVTVLRQKGVLGYGALFEAGSSLFEYTTMTAAPMVGVFLDGPRSLRLGVAATGGLHTYSGVGKGFISSSDPGASGAAPFVGARVLAGAELGGKARFHIGVLLGVDDDLTRTSKTYTFTESAWTTPHAATATHTIGDLRATAMLTLGTAFDL
jgi:hypothetical protein